MNNQGFSKIWIIVILIICIAGGILVWQYFSQQEEVKAPEELAEDETADWKTYKNEEYGFEIKYPDSGDWQTEISTVGGDPAGNPVVIIKSSESHSYLTITKRANENNFTLDEWLNNLAISTGQNFENFKKVFINGIEAYRYDYGYTSWGPQIKTVVIANQQREIFTPFSFSELPKDDPILEEMLSSFRFLKAEKPYIEVISPNGGEKLIIGNTYDIKWESKGVEKVDINLYGPIPNQKPFSELIATGILTSSGEYSWTISEDIPPGNNFVIIINQEGEVYPRDESDNYFNIEK